MNAILDYIARTEATFTVRPHNDLPDMWVAEIIGPGDEYRSSVAPSPDEALFGLGSQV